MKKKSKKNMSFYYCPACGGGLDTGWECNSCGRDWKSFAYPWRQRFVDKLKSFLRIK